MLQAQTLGLSYKSFILFSHSQPKAVVSYQQNSVQPFSPKGSCQLLSYFWALKLNEISLASKIKCSQGIVMSLALKKAEGAYCIGLSIIHTLTLIFLCNFHRKHSLLKLKIKKLSPKINVKSISHLCQTLDSSN